MWVSTCNCITVDKHTLLSCVFATVPICTQKNKPLCQELASQASSLPDKYNTDFTFSTAKKKVWQNCAIAVIPRPRAANIHLVNECTPIRWRLLKQQPSCQRDFSNRFGDAKGISLKSQANTFLLLVGWSWSGFYSRPSKIVQLRFLARRRCSFSRAHF